MSANTQKKRRVLSLFILTMLNVAIMASLRNLPLVSSYGLSAVFFFVIVGIFFLIPSALVSAELATGWHKVGGVYVWVREALGEKWGFVAIWMQWVHNISWYPVILSFVASTLAYVVSPQLAENKIYVFFVIILSFWGMTWINYLGIQASSWFSAIGVILGTIIPGLLIISLGLSWILHGNPINTEISLNALLPEFTGIGDIVFLAGLFLAFAGFEVSSAHASEVRNPQKNYPRSIIMAAVITFSVFMLGSLAIAFVIPKERISLVTGVMEALNRFFAHYHLEWLLPIIAILFAIGAIAEVNAWIVGPVKGLYATTKHGLLPPVLHKVNKHSVPVNLLFFQAIIVSVTSLVVLQLPTISAAFWILSVMSAQIYLVMYILMFISGIRLRYTKPHVPRTYKIPYGRHGMWILCVLGIIGSLFATFIGFFPPAQLHVGSLVFYELFLILGLVIMFVIPLIAYKLRKPHWLLEVKDIDKHQPQL